MFKNGNSTLPISGRRYSRKFTRKTVRKAKRGQKKEDDDDQKDQIYRTRTQTAQADHAICRWFGVRHLLPRRAGVAELKLGLSSVRLVHARISGNRGLPG